MAMAFAWFRVKVRVGVTRLQGSVGGFGFRRFRVRVMIRVRV